MGRWPVGPEGPTAELPGQKPSPSRARVTSRELYIDAVGVRKACRHLAGHGDRPVPPAGATERDHYLRSSVVPIVWNRRAERFFEVVEQLLGGGLFQDVIAHSRVASIQGTQLFDPVRIVEEPHVDDPRRAIWNSVLVTKRKTRDEEAVARAQRMRKLSQLSDVNAMVGPVVTPTGPAV
jgi:hypothetical protein